MDALGTASHHAPVRVLRVKDMGSIEARRLRVDVRYVENRSRGLKDR